MPVDQPIGASIQHAGVSRRAFLKYCSSLASLLALPATRFPAFSAGISRARRLPVIWLSFQECTGCTESLTRSAAPTLENLLFDFVSLDYHHTLMAACGDDAESARHSTMASEHGRFLLVVDGSIPTRPGFSTTGRCCSRRPGHRKVHRFHRYSPTSHCMVSRRPSAKPPPPSPLLRSSVTPTIL